MDHEEERRRNSEEWEMFQSEVVDVVRNVRPDVDDALVHKLIGILNTNSVSFSFKKDARKWEFWLIQQILKMSPGDEFSIRACPSQVTAVLPTPDILVSF